MNCPHKKLEKPEYDINTTKGARQYLISEGIDPDETVAKGLEVIRKMMLDQMNELQVKINDLELESLEERMLKLKAIYNDFENKYPQTKP